MDHQTLGRWDDLSSDPAYYIEDCQILNNIKLSSKQKDHIGFCALEDLFSTFMYIDYVYRISKKSQVFLKVLSFFDKEADFSMTQISCALIASCLDLKSVNLQYNTVGHLDDGTNQASDVPSIIFLMISCKILCKTSFNLFSYFFYNTKIKIKSFEGPNSLSKWF